MRIISKTNRIVTQHKEYHVRVSPQPTARHTPSSLQNVLRTSPSHSVQRGLVAKQASKLCKSSRRIAKKGKGKSKSKRSSGKDQDVEVSENESEASDQKHEDSQLGTVSKRVSSAMLKADRIPIVTFPYTHLMAA